MQIELTNDEQEELTRILDSYLRETRVEIRHTQNREYRNQLHQEEEILRGLLAKLGRRFEAEMIVQ